MNILETDKGFVLSCIGLALFGFTINLLQRVPDWLHKASLPVTEVWF